MVIDHVDDALHAPVVDGVDQMPEIIQRAEFGVHGAVVADGVGAAERALAVLFAGRVNGQQPDDVRAERLDAVEVRLHGSERCPLRNNCGHRWNTRPVAAGSFRYRQP